MGKKENGSATKRQHYVPRFYLRHFSDGNGKLHAYRRGGSSVFLAAPENVCVENYLYEAKADDASRGEGPHFEANHIEGMLSHFESKLAPLYDLLISCCEERNFASSKFLHGWLGACVLAANLIVRQPTILSENRNDAERLAQIYFRDRQDVFRGHERLDVRGNERAAAELVIMQASLFSADDRSPIMQVFNSLAEKRLHIVAAPANARFISCSFPVFIEGLNDDADDFETAYMPLSSEYSVVFCNEEDAPMFSKANDAEVRGLNEKLLSWSPIWQTAFGCEEESLMHAVGDWKTR